MTPTDDEGATSLNHTQKIPISLIKAKDKASVSILQFIRYFLWRELFSKGKNFREAIIALELSESVLPSSVALLSIYIYRRLPVKYLNLQQLACEWLRFLRMRYLAVYFEIIILSRFYLLLETISADSTAAS